MKIEKSGTLQHYSNVTRTIHLLTALTVTTALVISLFMQQPQGGKSGDFWFEVHEKAGLGALAVLVLFWLWTALRGGGEPKLGDWFPYLSGRRLKALWADIGAHLAMLGGGKLPVTEAQPLANAVHGLGALLATIMAATGTLGYFYHKGWALNLHEAFTIPIWIYFGGHVIMSLIHEFAKDPVLSNMFKFGKRKP